jgi:hypothetical protein
LHGKRGRAHQVTQHHGELTSLQNTAITHAAPTKSVRPPAVARNTILRTPIA